MKKMLPALAIAAMLATTPALAHDEEALKSAPPGNPYVKVSDVLPLPEFIPGLGTLYVNPETLPAGPFLAYDRNGAIAATIYMTPLEDLQKGTAYNGLSIGLHDVSGVDIYYNAGHPGVEKPHAHVVLYHARDARERLAK